MPCRRYTLDAVSAPYAMMPPFTRTAVATLRHAMMPTRHACPQLPTCHTLQRHAFRHATHRHTWPRHASLLQRYDAYAAAAACRMPLTPLAIDATRYAALCQRYA